jgi:hypothetical protein
VLSFMPRPLYLQAKSLCYPLDRRLGGLQSHSGREGEEKNSQPPQGIEHYNLDRPAPSLVTIPTELLLSSVNRSSYSEAPLPGNG